MQAVVLPAWGGAELFQIRDIERPVPGPGQVLGCDMAGDVVELGPGVDGFATGDAVYGSVGGFAGLGGTYAQYVLADTRLLAPKPRNLDWRQAAALPLVGLTAWEALERSGLKAGERILILGGTGGVGHVAVQLAKALGAEVTASLSSPAKAELALDLGADHAIDYRTEGLEAGVARLTGGLGYDLVFDTTGGSDLGPAFAAARLNGRIATIVAHFTADLTPMHLKGLSLHAVFMPIPLLHGIGREVHGRILRQLTQLAEAGRLKPLLDPESYGLAQLGEAQRRLEAGQALGKLVIALS
ncbi:MAG: zinc-binding dehydrogenase [Gammaproteobacteria bacterium]|nr:zinc-binding dehydrogenase [Gammaproteobacteria bacterium]